MVRPGNKKPVVAVIREEGSNGDRELVAAFRSVGFSVMDVIMSDLLTGKIADLKGFRGVAFPGGFSYSDVFGAGVAWAKKIQLHPHLREIFSDFYERRDTFSFGPCNGCQLMARLGWVPFGPELGSEKQPLFVRNISRAFESRPVVVEIRESPAIMLRGMAGCRLPVWVAHGEGRLWFPDEELAGTVRRMDLAPLCYVHPNGSVTERYPFNPNGSPNGWAGLCDKTGRHLAIMPHPERMWQMRQWPWVPCQWWNFEPSPWLRIFQNAYDWCCGK
jgi:phosphoribosylformylglycinamidine synthase